MAREGYEQRGPRIVDYCTQLCIMSSCVKTGNGAGPEEHMNDAREDHNWDKTPGEVGVHIIACQVLQDVLEPVLPAALTEAVTYQEYGLHRVPHRLRQALQDRVDAVEEPSLIVFGYGLCGTGVEGVKSRQHTLPIPRTDDCIAILLGSRQAYQREFSAVPGTYCLSKGWLESGSHPLSEYEDYAETYGAEEAGWILDQQYQHYERIALVAHSRAGLEAYAPAARQVADFCQRWGMRYEEILGSDEYVRRLLEAVVALRDEGMRACHRIGRDFVIVPPGREIPMERFVAGS